MGLSLVPGDTSERDPMALRIRRKKERRAVLLLHDPITKDYDSGELRPRDPWRSKDPERGREWQGLLRPEHRLLPHARNLGGEGSPPASFLVLRGGQRQKVERNSNRPLREKGKPVAGPRGWY